MLWKIVSGSPIQKGHKGSSTILFLYCIYKSSSSLLLKTSLKISKRTLHFMLTSWPVNSSIAAYFSRISSWIPAAQYGLHVSWIHLCSSNSSYTFFLFYSISCSLIFCCCKNLILASQTSVHVTL
jgi:hypothetical protein